METGEGGNISPGQEIDFCTLGMFIIDEIHFQSPKPPVYNVIGGAGSYSVLGARICSQNSNSKKIGWIVDRGSDFPASVETAIKSWKTSCFFRTDESRLTTRGWNEYDASENRAFRYATPKLRLDEKSLAECEPLLRSKSFHLICSPTRCIDLIKNVLHLRKGIPDHPPRPLFIWEPVPDSCVPSQLLEITRALRYVDICSPNHNELGALLSTPATLPNGDVDRIFVEDATELLLGSMPLSTFAIIVRAGKDGCYIAKNGGSMDQWLDKKSRRGSSKREKSNNNAGNKHPRPAHVNAGRALTGDADFEELFARLGNNGEEQSDLESSGEEEEPDWGTWKWLPAFHVDPAMVIDPTGGGNTFLGGLAVALARGASLVEAAKQGTVVASFAVEQVGMPKLGRNTLGYDTWNCVDPAERAWNYEARVA